MTAIHMEARWVTRRLGMFFDIYKSINFGMRLYNHANDIEADPQVAALYVKGFE
jgi:hypothetical protein